MEVVGQAAIVDALINIHELDPGLINLLVSVLLTTHSVITSVVLVVHPYSRASPAHRDGWSEQQLEARPSADARGPMVVRPVRAESGGDAEPCHPPPRGSMEHADDPLPRAGSRGWAGFGIGHNGQHAPTSKQQQRQ